jgi:OmpA-OmpF porin, OOP family
VLRALLTGAVLAATSSVASAADSGWQFGLAAGQSNLHISGGDVSGSDDTFGAKLFGGYKFNPYFALEAGYVHGGEFSDSEDGISASLEPRLLTAALRGTFPFTDDFGIAGFVKAGIARWDADLEVSDGFDSVSLDGNGTELLWGAGVSWAVRNMDVRLEYEQIMISDEEVVEDVVADFRYGLISLGVLWTF